MRKKADIILEVNKNFQPGIFGCVVPGVRDRTLIEVLIDIRDILDFQLKEIDRSVQGIKNKV